MSKFKVGDYVKGTSRGSIYSYTDIQMTRGKVVEIIDNKRIRVKILKHKNKNYRYQIGTDWTVESECFDLIGHTDSTTDISDETNDEIKFEVGDIICGTSDSKYGITTTKMTRGKVVKVYSNSQICVRVLEHLEFENEVGNEYDVSPKYFRLVERKK